MTRYAVRGSVFVIVATSIAFLVSLAASSLKSTVQVLFLPIADSFDVNRGTLAIATTLFAVVTAICSTVVGHLADRIGAVPVLAIGVATTGAVLLLCASSSDIGVFIVVYGVLGAIGFTMLSYVPLGVLAEELFHGRNAGLVYAVLTNGAAVGFIVLVPLWSFLAGSLSWNQILAGIGVVFLAVLVPLSLLLLRYTPRRARGAARADGGGETLRAGIGATLRHRGLRPLVIAFFACGTTMAFIDVHLFPALHDHGVPASVGSASVALLGVLEIIGSLVTGRVCDRGRTRIALVTAYLIRSASMVLLFFLSSDVAVLVFGAMFGASYLATVVATTVWVTRLMPAGTRGTALGVLWAVHMVAVAISGQAGAMLADGLGGYTVPVAISVVLTAGAALLVAVQPDPDAPAGEAALAVADPDELVVGGDPEPAISTTAERERPL